MDDLNSREYLEKIKEQVFENLRNTAFQAPSVQQQRKFGPHAALYDSYFAIAIPKLPRDDMELDEDLDNPDERKPRKFTCSKYRGTRLMKL